MKNKLLFFTVWMITTVFSIKTFSQAGQIDLSYGENGIVATAISKNEKGALSSVAIQEDGKIIAAGYYMKDNYDFALIRLKEDGKLDHTFGVNGMTLTNIEDNDFAKSVAIQSDGKIIAGGRTGAGNFTLVRYHSNGRLDETFGSDGIVISDLGSFSSLESIAIQNDGKILAAGWANVGTYPDIMVVRYDTDGNPDTGFGTDGVATIYGETTSDYLHSIVIQEDGKIVVAGQTNVFGNNDFLLIRFDAVGSLDNTFGTSGMVISQSPTSTDRINSVKLQSDGKIIAAGYSDFNGTNDFTLARYNANGSVDITFGTNGVVLNPVPISHEKINSILILEDDKIVASGITDYYGNSDIVVTRYNANGSLDNAFGTSGLVITRTDQSEITYSVLLQPDNKIVVAGETNEFFGIIRYNSDGTVDTTFGTGDITSPPVGSGCDAGLSAAIQRNGKIVAAGYSFNGMDNDFALVRFNIDGKLDNSFGTNGIVTTDISSSDEEGRSVAIQEDEKIVVAGTNGTHFIVVRYLSTGEPDNTFGTSGTVTTRLGTSTSFVTSVLIQDDGKILVAGNISTPTGSDLAIARYEPDGDPDTGFGTDGITTASPGTFAGIMSLALQQDGKIIAGGWAIHNVTGPHFVLARFKEDGTIDTDFGTDGIKVSTEIGHHALINSVAVQPDGKIIAAGYFGEITSHPVIARYNSDGTLDGSFGITGYLVDGTPNSIIYSILLQHDGKILAAGSSVNTSTPDARRNFSLFRFLPDGNIDNAFGELGHSSASIGSSQSVAYTALMQQDGNLIGVGMASLNSDENSYRVFTLVRFTGDPMVSVLEDLKEPSGNFILKENYPNPFRSTTTIEYQIPAAGFVTLNVYDLPGNKVATLVNEEKPFGEYSVQFNAAGLTPGVYLCRIILHSKSNYYSDTHKLIIQ